MLRILVRQDGNMEGIGNTVFQEPAHIAALFCSCDHSPNRFFRRRTTHGQVNVYGFHKAFCVRPGGNRRPGERNLARPRSDLKGHQQTTTQAAQEGRDRVGRGAIAA